MLIYHYIIHKTNKKRCAKLNLSAAITLKNPVWLYILNTTRYIKSWIIKMKLGIKIMKRVIQHGTMEVQKEQVKLI